MPNSGPISAPSRPSVYWMGAGLLYQFHGGGGTEPAAAIMPPVRQLIRCGLTLEKSNAGEMKLATMLMPTVAITKARQPSSIANVESMRCTVLMGSVMSSPNTGTVADAVITVSSEKNRKLTGRPRRLPFLTALKEGPYRGKPPKWGL